MIEVNAKIAQALMADTRPRGAIPEEDWYQMQFAPIKVRKGEWDWGVPDILQAPWDAWTREWDSALGYGPGVTPDQQLEDALAVAGVMTPGGMLRAKPRTAINPRAPIKPTHAQYNDDIDFAKIHELEKQIRDLSPAVAAEDYAMKSSLRGVPPGMPPNPKAVKPVNATQVTRDNLTREQVFKMAAQRVRPKASATQIDQEWQAFREFGLAAPAVLQEARRVAGAGGATLHEGSAPIAAIVAALQGEDR